jgi:hypothetical protein
MHFIGADADNWSYEQSVSVLRTMRFLGTVIFVPFLVLPHELPPRRLEAFVVRLNPLR